MKTCSKAALAAAALVFAVGAGATDAEKAALQVRNPRLAVQWVTPDTRVPPFDRVILAPIELEFRDVPPVAGIPSAADSRTEFPVSERERQRMTEQFAEMFREELGNSTHFTLTDEPGAGVLLVKPAMRDIVSRVPPEQAAGRSDIYVDSVADATLVVDFVDSATGRTLGTAMDRRTAEPGGAMGDFGAVHANPVGVNQEMRRLVRRWAMRLDKRVEQLYFEAKPR